MSSHAIAKCVADIRKGNVQNALTVRNDRGQGPIGDRAEQDELFLQTLTIAAQSFMEVVDATLMYHAVTGGNREIALYEDHTICPPFEYALVCYENEHGNVFIMSTVVIEQGHEGWATWDPQEGEGNATHTVDWDRVKWEYHTTIFMGGRGGGQPVPTIGPVHAWMFAVYPEGVIADMRWVRLREDLLLERFDNAQLVMLGTLNMLNCVNVELREPSRPRAEARRLQRTGVRVSEIHVKGISQSYRGGHSPVSHGVPLTTVRGHFAHYGPEYGRALLFNKYAGRFWIAQHARGTPEVGEVRHAYTVETET